MCTWAQAVIVVPAEDGVVLWNTASGARLLLPEFSGDEFPPLSAFNDDSLAALRSRGFVDEETQPEVGRRGMLGVARMSLAQAFRTSLGPEIVFLGAATDVGTSANPGARHGPEIVRNFTRRLYDPEPASMTLAPSIDPTRGPSALSGRRIVDVGDLFSVPFDVRLDRVAMFESIATTVRVIVSRCAKPIIVGGDHSVSAAAIDALLEVHDCDVLVFDAHYDAEPLGTATFEDLHHANFITYIHRQHPTTRVTVYGVREPSGPSTWPLPPTTQCLSPGDSIEFWLTQSDRPVYVSIDLDVIDPAHFPATGHPSTGGLTVQELVRMIASVGRYRKIVGGDVVEALHSSQHDYTTGMVVSRVLDELAKAMVP